MCPADVDHCRCRDLRREQLVLCRLRLPTSLYLVLTVEHILIHCAEYFHVRIQCFDVDNLQELFNTVSPDTILGFIQRVRIFFILY